MTIAAGSVTVDAADFSNFAAGDTVLLIQMKGAEILVPNDPSYGLYQISVGTPGAYEFLMVESTTFATKTITFRNNILNSYNVLGDVQLVYVPSYNAAKVDAELNCAAWNNNTKVGGVLSLFVGTTLTLNANINVKASGFKGGDAVSGDGFCINSGSGLNDYSYPETYNNSGLKGESHASLSYPGLLPLYPGYAKGFGSNYTGGGGGNGRFSGGGGGAMVGSGGKGGLENCSPNEYGGMGGRTLKFDLSSAGFYMGGGGGGSTYTTGTASSGGRGGGIAIIVCETLDGNSKSIIADGETPATSATGNAGAGGGGGGGTVALYLQNFSANNITLSAKGGTGGNSLSTFGEGGGGGGGRITVSILALPGNVTKTVAGGLYGTKFPSGHDATSGTAGDNNTVQFIPKLNGFLFNSIRSSVTLNQVDSICSNVVPPAITGTLPIGGSGSYSYVWQIKYSLAGLPSVIGGATSQNYTPGAAEANTHWIRRIVKDDVSSLTDTSKWVQMIVQPAITGNTIGNDTTICFGQNPLKLRHIGTPAGGYGNLHYHWLQNTTNIWSAYARAEGTDSTKADFDPANLILTTYYKRKINSGHCVDYSNTVTITALPSISNNLLNSHDSIICEGFLFDSLKAKKPAGGSSAYIYQWQDKMPLTAWADITSATGKAYFPDTSKFNDTDSVRYFRRIVYSGLNNTCIDQGPQVKLTRFPKISNNLITSPDTTICSGKPTNVRKGTVLTGGDGTPHWLWEQSTNSGGSWTNAASTNTNQNYLPPVLTITTWYRRNVSSSVCINTSNVRKVFVDPVITNYSIAPDTTICSSTPIFMIRGMSPDGGTGAYGYSWKKSIDNISFPVIGGASSKDYTPAASHTQPTWYRRIVTSGACKDSNQVKIDVLPLIGGNAIQPDKPDVCFISVPGTLIQTGGGLTGGSGAGSYTYLWQDSVAGGSWVSSNGTNTNATYSPIDQLIKTKWFRRKVTSGPANCCFNFSVAVQVDTITLPTGDIPAASNPDTTICGGGDARIRLKLTGEKPWKVTYDGDATGVVLTGINNPDYLITRKPAVTAAFSSFLFKYASLEDKNGCLATSKTGSRKVDVYRVPNTNAGPDGSVCGPAYKLAAVPSDGIGAWTWEVAAQIVAPFPAAYNSTVYIDSSYTAPYKKYKLYWSELNGICPNKDSVEITFYNRIDTINAGADSAIISFDNMTQVKAYPIQSYETGKWSVVAGTGNFDNDAALTTDVKNISIGINTYKWTVTNGECILSDEVTYDITVPVIPEGISPDGDLTNDTLRIDGLDFDNQVVELSIINGAGTLVFSSSNKNGEKWINWDGKNSKGNELPEGTYYYILKVTSPKTGHIVKKSGFILLKRQ
ncbi:MAG: gliding motility-associated C-terminal domain-containing protein [Bacteroidia bacterium]|nr:gliding motility-associated C-terminal domain-containing protein [Bacteroidia bacterium]